jgi:hypothetical protein
MVNKFQRLRVSIRAFFDVTYLSRFKQIVSQVGLPMNANGPAV